MMSNEEIDYKLAAEQLRTGKPLFGKDGALAPLLERILNAALEGEKAAHLSEESRVGGIVVTLRCPRQSRLSMVK